MKIELRKEVTEFVTVIRADGSEKKYKVTVKKSLRAKSCAGCGQSFMMLGGVRDAGDWRAWMDQVHDQHGNGLRLNCCSFECAHTLKMGGWKKPKSLVEYDRTVARDFARLKCDASRVEFNVGSVIYKDDLIQEWEEEPLLEIEIKVVPKSAGHIGFRDAPVVDVG